MTNLLDDLATIAAFLGPHARVSAGDAFNRISAHVQATLPWYPPQPEGFGPWIEYKEGDKGPCVNDEVCCLLFRHRYNKKFRVSSRLANSWSWNQEGDEAIVAYCVRETP